MIKLSQKNMTLERSKTIKHAQILRIKMGRLLKRIYKTLKYGTTIDAIRCRLKLIGIDVALYYLMEENPHFSPSLEFKERAKDYTFEFLGPEDMKTVGELYALQSSKEHWLSLLKEGKKCISAKYNGQIVAAMWFALDECDTEWGKFKLKENEAYLFSACTKMDFRGRQIASYLRYASYNALKSMGRQRLYSYSSVLNKSSIKYKTRLNAKFSKLGLHVSIFKKFKRNFIVADYTK